MMRDLATRLVTRFGYEIIPRWRLDRFEQTKYLRRLFDYLQIDCVLDVGANVGQYRDYLRYEVGFVGHIVSFEPIPRNVETLKARAVYDSRWIIKELALGASPETKTFNVMRHNSLSSFLQPDHSHFDFQLNRVEEQIQVQVTTLDSVVPPLLSAYGAKSVYLKLDTQGYDLEVTKGAVESARIIQALQTEASIRPIYQGMPSLAESIATIQRMGFEVSGLFPVNYGAFPMLLEVDCHMVASDRCRRGDGSHKKESQVA